MSQSERLLGPQDVPAILREFENSTWESMVLRAEGLSIAVGRSGAPPSAGDGGATAAPSSAQGPAAEAPGAEPAPALSEPDDADDERDGGDDGDGSKAVTATPAPADREGLVSVRSPALGTFYSAPKPGAPPFVEVGQAVEEDDTVAIVEVMKLMNHVAAGVRGEVVEVLAANGDMIEYEQELLLVRPAEEEG